jgi:hypothetical protein
MRQPMASSHAMNHAAPPESRPSQTPSVAKPTVRATSPITRPKSAGVDAREGAYAPKAEPLITKDETTPPPCVAG